jgi:hypothetical protein
MIRNPILVSLLLRVEKIATAASADATSSRADAAAPLSERVNICLRVIETVVSLVVSAAERPSLQWCHRSARQQWRYTYSILNGCIAPGNSSLS